MKHRTAPDACFLAIAVTAMLFMAGAFEGTNGLRVLPYHRLNPSAPHPDGRIEMGYDNVDNVDKTAPMNQIYDDEEGGAALSQPVLTTLDNDRAYELMGRSHADLTKVRSNDQVTLEGLGSEEREDDLRGIKIEVLVFGVLKVQNLLGGNHLQIQVDMGGYRLGTDDLANEEMGQTIRYRGFLNPEMFMEKDKGRKGLATQMRLTVNEVDHTNAFVLEVGYVLIPVQIPPSMFGKVEVLEWFPLYRTGRGQISTELHVEVVSADTVHFVSFNPKASTSYRDEVECKENGNCSGEEGAHGTTTNKCPNDCSFHGVCEKSTCICNVHYKGDDCSEPIFTSECPRDCSGHGICNDVRCDCSDNFSGVDCSTRLPTTVCPEDCNGRGTCTDGACVCSPPWNGVACETQGGFHTATSETPECPMGLGGQVCSGRGRCHDNGVCECADGSEGDSCQDLSSHCPGDCSGHGSCVDGACKCAPAYFGQACASTVASTNCPDDCSGHGVCAGNTCKCAPGFDGLNCAADAPSCPNDCNGHGKCESNVCHCDLGWKGDGCNAAPCPLGCNAPHGECKDDVCVCLGEYSGPSCKIAPVPPCGLECSSHGTCFSDKCVCVEGWEGPLCEETNCPANCHERGKCIGGKCYCSPEFTGTTCELPNDKPVALGCKPDCQLPTGTCRGGKCFCRPGWKGETCSERQPMSTTCWNGKCSGHGTCNADDGCVCEEGWSGNLCNKGLDPYFKLDNEVGTFVIGESISIKYKFYDYHALGDWVGLFVKGECETSGKKDIEKCVLYHETVPDGATEGFFVLCGDKMFLSEREYEARYFKDGHTTVAFSTEFRVVNATGCSNDCYGRGVCKNTTVVEDRPKADASTGDANSAGGSAEGGGATDSTAANAGGGAMLQLWAREDPGEAVAGDGEGADQTIAWKGTGNDTVTSWRWECECHPLFTGEGCDQLANKVTDCPLDCMNRGICEGGACVCNAKWEGPSCATERRDYNSSSSNCANLKGCHGNGVCMSGACTCHPHFQGAACNEPMDFVMSAQCPNMCSGHGVCESGSRCNCGVTYTGLDCSVPEPSYFQCHKH